MNLDLFTFTYYYGNGDYYTGQGYAEAGTYAASQVLTGYANETGYAGSYTIDSVVDSDYDPSSGYNNYVYVTSYYDGDTSFSSYSAEGYGYSGLGSEYGTVTGLFYSDSFSNYDEADLDYDYPPTYDYDQYNFTYYYGNGDSYSGYGYASVGTYYAGQTIGSYANETGNYGYYYIDSVYFGSSYDYIPYEQVSVTSYYDGDTSFSSYYAEGYGYYGLGSESGTVYGYYSSDSFSNYDEADLYYDYYYYDQYNFTYYYGNGDSYSGYGYASAGTYYSGQTLDSYWNETGNNGYYIIDSVYSFSGSSDGEVYVNSYYDGDTSFSSYYAEGYGYSGLGSESGTVYGSFTSDYFSTYDEADLDYYYPPTYYDQYNFTYYYGNGDSYSGYGYALAGTYYAGQTVDSNWNETGNYGYYIIDSVYSGIGSSYDEVYVTGYYDGDTGYGYASSVSGSGYYGLGSEFGTVSGFYSSDDFSPYSEADLYNYYSYDQYNFTYYYGNGDSYSGHGYALAGTYYSGQTISPYPNETGNDGYYIIDSVYSGIGGSDGQVYVTSYTDGDTSLSTYLVSGFGYSGLGSESGTVSGSSSSDSFSNYYEADLLNSSPTLANDLASAILGNGVAIINPSFIGDSRAASLFNDSSLGIGITSGIILSTGDVANIYGPNDSDSTSTALGTNGDDDLNSLVTPSSTLDAAVLEFDFVPTQNFLSFSYVFASEEYNEYVNTSFNDVFGFFLTDSLGNKQNIAIIPGTTTPIAINNINLGSNPAYYRNNDPSDYGFGTTPFNTEFDGLTTVLTAIANVTPGETYRFKLAIADNSDRVLDSAVFITGGTFETTPIVAVNDSVKVNQSQPITINVLGNDLVAGSEIPIIADFQVISDNGGTITLFDNGTPDNLSDDQLIYTPSTGFTGVDEFKYTLADSAGNTHTAGVYVEVSPVSVLVSDFYYFTYYYGDGSQDYYEGYGYVAGGTYHEGQIISPYPNETGNNGYYTIGAVYSGYTGVEDEVTVTSYYDVDTGYGSVDSIFGSDSSILGTESGNVYDANGNSFDSQFSNYYEADLISHSVYYLTDYLSWLDAQAQAQAMGGNLATINNATENQFLANAFDVGWLWIGYTDQAEEGVWQWISGETSTYTNWAQWEPNNSGDEDYAVTNWEGSGTWNDLPNWYGNSIKGIVEVVGGVSSLSVGDVSVAENGSYEVVIPVTLKGITNQIFTVDYSLAPGTATENQDYTLVTGTLTFNPGDSVQYIFVSLQDDDVIEGNETFFVNLSNVTGGAVLDQSTATVTIAENEKYTFTYTYGNGDSYSGYGYALAGTYAAGQVLSGYSNETDNDGYYTIDSIEDSGELGTEGLVYVTSYTDGDTGFGTTTNIGDPNWGDGVHGYMGLGSEQGYAFNATPWTGDYYFNYYSEADLPGVVQVRLNLLADDGGNPGELIANNQIGVNKYFFVEILVADLRGNAVGVNGLGLDLSWDGFILESINFDPSLDITSQFPLLQDGTLVDDGFIDDLSGGSLPAFELGQAIGVNQLERFALLRFYTENSSNGTSYFTTTVSSAALADDASYSLDVEENEPIEILAPYNQYNFTYSYGNGDFYTGYVYALEGTYAAGQVLSGYPNETGNDGFYTIDSIGSSTFDSWYNNQVYVTSYYDGDTGYGLTTNIGEDWWTADGIHGYYGLGSEQGYAYDTNGNSSDPYFGYNYEADILGNQLFNYTYHYGNGDSYNGYGYAAVGTYTVGQIIGEYSNETGFSGYYVIDSVELGNTNAGYNGQVYITSYTDADTEFGTTTNLYNYGNPATYSGLGYEASYAYDNNGLSSDPYFSNYSEADILNQYYTFTYTYGNGDYYEGYGYALAGTYAANQVLSGYWNETGYEGYYTINSVSAGTTDSSYNNRVYVTSYTDGDTGYGLTTNIGEADYPWWDGIHGSSGLGSEQGNAYDTNGNSYDSYFSNSSEADIFANQKFNYTYHYGNGDSYTGYVFAAVGNYTAGQELSGYWNETGNNGYYTIDSVELGNNNPGYNGYVYITSYTDGDTSYAYGTTTNIGEDWWTADGIHGYSGLGSESGHAYTADGYSYDSYFDHSNEADLIVPSISITDNSDVPDDASIKFTTELSPFRKNYSYSEYVRPNYADSTKYFDITNTGTAVLTVSGLQINVAGVTTDLDLTEGDLLINPNQSQRVQLTYTAAAAKEVFDRSDALVLFTNAIDIPEFAIALSGKSTFNSDINYDGKVNTGDLGSLNQAAKNYKLGIFDPTTDINGDGMINSLDVSVLLSENKMSVFG